MQAEVKNMQTTSNLPATQKELSDVPQHSVTMYQRDLTEKVVQQYFAPPDATREDIIIFLGLCKAQNLNPWLNDCYMIPFQGKAGRKYASVTAYQVLLDRADPFIEGLEIDCDPDTDKPESCTVTVHRIGWKIPFKRKTMMAQVMRFKRDGKPMAVWATNERAMLEKCAVTAALRMGVAACRRFYIEEEFHANNQEAIEPQTQLPEATVVSASPADIDYLRGQYFKYGKGVWEDDDARHAWNVAHGFKESVKEWEVRDFERAIDILDPGDEPGAGLSEEEARREAERMEAELGKDATTEDAVPADEDGSGSEAEPDDGSDPAMDSGDDTARQHAAEIAARIAEIELYAQSSPFKKTNSVGFVSWRNQILPDCNGIALADLSLNDLDIIINALKEREDKGADDAAESSGTMF